MLKKTLSCNFLGRLKEILDLPYDVDLHQNLMGYFMIIPHLSTMFCGNPFGCVSLILFTNKQNHKKTNGHIPHIQNDPFK